jgi:hypothetical protein
VGWLAGGFEAPLPPPVGRTVAVAVGDGLGVGDGVALGEGVAVAVAVGLGVAVAVGVSPSALAGRLPLRPSPVSSHTPTAAKAIPTMPSAVQPRAWRAGVLKYDRINPIQVQA